MRNWKTTAIGAGTALCAFVLFSPEHFKQWPWMIDFAKFATAGGLAMFGFFAKDHDVSGPAR